MFGLCEPLLWSRGKRSKFWEGRVQSGSISVTYPPCTGPQPSCFLSAQPDLSSQTLSSRAGVMPL